LTQYFCVSNVLIPLNGKAEDDTVLLNVVTHFVFLGTPFGSVLTVHIKYRE